MNILVISRTAWRKDNSFGNTYSNIFENMAGTRIANLYLGDGVPEISNSNISDFYRISEKKVFGSIVKKRTKKNRVGEKVYPEKQANDTKDGDRYDKTLVRIKKIRWNLFYIIRELVWKIGQIDYDGILGFVNEFKPDIIFVSFYYAMYTNRMARFIRANYNAPMVLEAAVDIYTLKQFSLDPFFWINRLLIRNEVRRTIHASNRLYVISQEMKNDYSKFFNIDTRILYKFPEIERRTSDYQLKENGDLTYIYTGNISSGRWKSLAQLGDVLQESGAGKLYIYTRTPVSRQMRRKLANCVLMPAVDAEEVRRLQNSADVLVHVESFDLKDRLEVRYSISTKIMDYISAERCILAYGPAGIASVEYMRRNELALVCSSEDELRLTIGLIHYNKELILKYAGKCRDYCKDSMSKKDLQAGLKRELEELIV